MKQKNNPTTYAFIDSQNLNLGVRSQGWELDFARFRTLLKDKYNVSKAYLFIGLIPDNQPLYTYLQEVGYILIFKPTLTTKIEKEIKIKGNVDAELVLHSMIQFPHYDQAVIVTGDGDFYCLVEYLHQQKKLGKIIVPNHKYSSLLRKFAKNITAVKYFKNKVEKQ